MPSGYRSYAGTFLSMGSGGFWWSKTEFSEVNAYARHYAAILTGYTITTTQRKMDTPFVAWKINPIT